MPSSSSSPRRHQQSATYSACFPTSRTETSRSNDDVFDDVEAAGDNTAASNAVADMAASSHDDAAKLRRALVIGGVGQAATALYMALFKQPAGLFHRARLMHYSYYCALVVVVLFGVAEAWVRLWVSHDPRCRRSVGVAVLWASLLPLLLLAGVGASRL